MSFRDRFRNDGDGDGEGDSEPVGETPEPVPETGDELRVEVTAGSLGAPADVSKAVAYLKQVFPVPASEPDPLLESPVCARRFSEYVGVFYLIDDGERFAMVGQADRKAAGISEDQLHQIGLKNLAAQMDTMKIEGKGGLWTVTGPGHFEASLVLLDSLWETGAFAGKLPNGPAVAIPARDSIIICDKGDSKNVATLRRLAGLIMDNPQPHPLSRGVFARKETGEWEIVAPPRTGARDRSAVDLRQAVAYLKKAFPPASPTSDSLVEDSKLCIRRFSDNIIIHYTVPRPDGRFHTITHEEREAAGLTDDELHQIAIQNLGARNIGIISNTDGIVFTGVEGYEASLILLDGLWDSPQFQEMFPNGPIVAMPSRDVLVAFDSQNSEAKERLEKLVERAWKKPQTHPLSRDLYVRQNGGWAKALGEITENELAALEEPRPFNIREVIGFIGPINHPKNGWNDGGVELSSLVSQPFCEEASVFYYFGSEKKGRMVTKSDLSASGMTVAELHQIGVDNLRPTLKAGFMEEIAEGSGVFAMRMPLRKNWLLSSLLLLDETFAMLDMGNFPNGLAATFSTTTTLLFFDAEDSEAMKKSQGIADILLGMTPKSMIDSVKKGYVLHSYVLRDGKWEQIPGSEAGTGTTATPEVSVPIDEVFPNKTMLYEQLIKVVEAGFKVDAGSGVVFQTGPHIPGAHPRPWEADDWHEGVPLKPDPPKKQGLMSKLKGETLPEPVKPKPKQCDPFCGDSELAAVVAAYSQGDWRQAEQFLNERNGDVWTERTFRANVSTFAGTLNEWHEASPSARTFTLHANQKIVEGWNARGTGMGNTVSTGAAMILHANLQTADKLADQAIALDPTTPEPWSVKITVCYGRQKGITEARRLFSEAHERSPFHAGAVAGMTQALSEKWGGSEEQVLAFVRWVNAEAPANSPARAAFPSTVYDNSGLFAMKSGTLEGTGTYESPTMARTAYLSQFDEELNRAARTLLGSLKGTKIAEPQMVQAFNDTVYSLPAPKNAEGAKLLFGLLEAINNRPTKFTWDRGGTQDPVETFRKQMLHRMRLADNFLSDENESRFPTTDAEPATGTEAEQRRDRSNAMLAAQDIEVIDHLPVIEDSSETTLRPSVDVAKRAACLLMVALKAQSDLSGTLADAHPRLQRLINDFQIAEHLSPDESAYINNPRPGQAAAVQFLWKYEALHTLLWALGHVKELEPPLGGANITETALLIESLGPAGLTENTYLRPPAEILDALDYTYRLHRAVDDASANGGTVPGTDASVVIERRYALNWLIASRGEDWDNVQMNT